MQEIVPQIQGTVFDIQRYSIHDGPGIRTIVFLKGCPLSCQWCCNPESQHPHPELQVRDDGCIACGACVSACTGGFVTLKNGRPNIDRDLCIRCGACSAVCPTGVISTVGHRYNVEALTQLLQKDEPFFRTSGGGVTLSGGEPLVQHEFCLALQEALAHRGISMCIETCGVAPWEALSKVAKGCVAILFDIKEVNPEKHRAFTGGSNETILANARQLVQGGYPVTFRVPVIPGRNGTLESLTEIATFLKEIGYTRPINLLPYHNLGENKYGLLDRPYPLTGLARPDMDEMTRLAEAFAPFHIPVLIGSQATHTNP